MKIKVLLARSIEVITFLFGAFGHFLTRVAPPDSTGLSFAVGFSSMVCLCILLIISLISKNMTAKSHQKFWLIPAVICLLLTFGSAVFYWGNYHRLTFAYPQDQPQGRHLAGAVLTPKAKQYAAEYPDLTMAEIVADFGGIPAKAKVWPQAAIDDAESLLTLNYVLLVIFLSTAIFCLLEGLLLKKNSP